MNPLSHENLRPPQTHEDGRWRDSPREGLEPRHERRASLTDEMRPPQAPSMRDELPEREIVAERVKRVQLTPHLPDVPRRGR
jgi:hypothetical protein